jgi:hypothetical protein
MSFSPICFAKHNSEELYPLPPGFLQLFILKDLKSSEFGSVHSAGVTELFFGLRTLRSSGLEVLVRPNDLADSAELRDEMHQGGGDEFFFGGFAGWACFSTGG